MGMNQQLIEAKSQVVRRLGAPSGTKPALSGHARSPADERAWRQNP